MVIKLNAIFDGKVLLPEENVNLKPNTRVNLIIESTELEEDNIKWARFHRALEISSGAWKDENHPELASIIDIVKYVNDMRNAKRA